MTLFVIWLATQFLMIQEKLNGGHDYNWFVTLWPTWALLIIIAILIDDD